ncbi:MAG: thiamine pyrophosphate-dependent enzyme [Microgenomates group bacterium]|nr:thiamine pyrophosphate-dependent enzyme [Microgenomates group bacterium]
MVSINDFNGYPPTWCPGCGNWAIGVAIKTALTQLNFSPSSIVAVFGIGCSGNMNDFLNAYAIHSLHGRAIPNAIGIKLANHNLRVLAIVGDGDCYGEGGNHFIHACRGNHDITVIVHDNRVYGLTTGQVAPTAQKGFQSKSTPAGIIEVPLDPLSLAIISGATFVSQVFAGETIQMIEIIKKAIQHQGFSLVNVLQPCVSFNKVNTYQYYKERIFKLDKNHNPKNKQQALMIASSILEEKFPLGIIYQSEELAYHQQLKQLESGQTLISRPRFNNFEAIFKNFI